VSLWERVVEGVVVVGSSSSSSSSSSGSGSSSQCFCWCMVAGGDVGAIWLLLACFAKVAGVFLERLHPAFQLQRG